MQRIASLFLLCLWAISASAADVEVYGIDNSHSFANWAIRHVVSKTSGTFTDVAGKISIDRDNLANSSVEARINVFSVNSSHAKRDEHIKKEEYLDASRYKEMYFVSSKVTPTGKNEGILTGKLTMHGVTRAVEFPFKVLGFGADPWGGQRMGVEAHTSLKASDYGFPWPLQPNPPVGDDIEITLLIEGVKNSPDFKPW